MSENWTANNIPDLSGKIIIITGANSGIGFEAARELARKGAEVILASRDPIKADQAILRIKEEYPGAKLKFIELNLTSLESIRKFAEEFKLNYSRLDILLNNAGIMMVPEAKTEDGFERQLGTNHLGHFALTGLLIDYLVQTAGARVVNISSNAHYTGEIDFDNLFYDHGGYSPMGAYSQSKLANLLFTYELQRRLDAQGAGTMALAAHPGISATGLADHFVNEHFTWLVSGVMKLIFQRAAMGALPGLRAAIDPNARGGEYYGPDGKGERSGYPVVVSSNPASHNLQDAKNLWDISEELTGVKYLS